MFTVRIYTGTTLSYLTAIRQLNIYMIDSIYSLSSFYYILVRVGGKVWQTGKGVQRIYIVEYIYYCTTCSYLLVHTCKNVDIYCVVGIAMVEAIAT